MLSFSLRAADLARVGVLKHQCPRHTRATTCGCPPRVFRGAPMAAMGSRQAGRAVMQRAARPTVRARAGAETKPAETAAAVAAQSPPPQSSETAVLALG